MYTLDTNAIIYYLNGDKDAVQFLNKILARPVTLYVSAMVEIELFSSKNVSQIELSNIEAILETTFNVPIDSRVAKLAAKLRRDFNIKIPDSAIAATALLTNTTLITPLITRNDKDFRKIPDLKLERI
ncbi:MAG: PilT protein-like protein [Parcubacteria group bacterium GW2011_GWB1_44_7]|nr:MAG: PilT protein-like protein [Parcubacteria group bacterium GW2011_GWB1_44_7]